MQNAGGPASFSYSVEVVEGKVGRDLEKVSARSVCVPLRPRGARLHGVSSYTRRSRKTVFAGLGSRLDDVVAGAPDRFPRTWTPDFDQRRPLSQTLRRRLGRTAAP